MFVLGIIIYFSVNIQMSMHSKRYQKPRTENGTKACEASSEDNHYFNEIYVHCQHLFDNKNVIA